MTLGKFDRIVSSGLETGLFQRLIDGGEYIKRGKLNAKKRLKGSTLYSGELSVYPTKRSRRNAIGSLVIVIIGSVLGILVFLGEQSTKLKNFKCCFWREKQ